MPSTNAPAGAPSLGQPQDRRDRLIAVSVGCEHEAIAEVSVDGGSNWLPATVYPGATVDEWRTAGAETWNRSVLEGHIPEGAGACVWNPFFDVDLPAEEVRFRIRSTNGDEILIDQNVDLTGVGIVIDHRSFTRMPGGRLPEPWSLKPAEVRGPSRPSLLGEVESVPYDSEYPTSYVKNAHLPPLALRPGVDGWHRVYVAMEPAGAVRVSLSDTGPLVPVPGEDDDRLLCEYCIGTADLTDGTLRLALGGSRVWSDTWIRYIRLVPMSSEEVEGHSRARQLAETSGLPFIGYLEQLTDGYRKGETISVQEHTRNEMELHKRRGCNDVYVHVIRIGFSAWYYSQVVERYVPEGPRFEKEDPAQFKWAGWMAQGDPMAVAVDEARRVGLGVFADVGMNITYLATDRFHYRAMTSRFAEDHPEYMCPESASFFDYRHRAVQDYAVAIIRELMVDYDIDGVHLDFARFAHNRAFDEQSLIDVMERIHDDRRKAEGKWGHPLTVAVRIPSYMFHTWDQYTGDYPEFLSALKIWARNGWIDRAMACSMLVPRLHELSLTRYKEALSGTDVQLWGDLYGFTADMPRSRPLSIAKKWRDEGLDGGFFFYHAGRPIEFDAINWQLRLIDQPELHQDLK